MSRRAGTITLVLLILVAPALILPLSRVTAGDSQEPAFERAWERTDRPVAEGLALRTWLWGPNPLSDILSEAVDTDDVESRTVQYFDKGRMEISDTVGDPDSLESVQSGALVGELIAGTTQNGGPGTPEPSTAPVAGDTGDPNSVSYSSLAPLLSNPAFDDGAILATRISPDGELVVVPDLAAYEVTAGEIDGATGHRIASVFWEFLNSSGEVWSGEANVDEPLFSDPAFATGPPLSEAYWIEANVETVLRDVLVQCFERRCLTYTPDNPDGWQVEFNNAGKHYYDWRYGMEEAGPPVDPTEPPVSELPIGTIETETGETHSIQLEVAAHDATRSCGLMHRLDLAADTGMLFVWDQDQQGSFWNCNTFVALTLAWIDEQGIFIGFSEMEPQIPGEPQDVTNYPPPGPYRYVIEANQGWFAERGITEGDFVDLSQALGRGDTGSDTLCQQLGLECN